MSEGQRLIQLGWTRAHVLDQLETLRQCLANAEISEQEQRGWAKSMARYLAVLNVDE